MLKFLPVNIVHSLIQLPIQVVVLKPLSVKLVASKIKAELLETEAKKVAKSLAMARCEYLKDLFSEATLKHNFTLWFNLDTCQVTIQDSRTRIYARGFEDCENLLLTLL